MPGCDQLKRGLSRTNKNAAFRMRLEKKSRAKLTRFGLWGRAGRTDRNAAFGKLKA